MVNTQIGVIMEQIDFFKIEDTLSNNAINQVFKRRIMMDKLLYVLTIVIIICNFIIAITNYFQAISSHDAYYISLGIFHLVLGGLCMLLKKD